jgi:hypothetical protein
MRVELTYSLRGLNVAILACAVMLGLRAGGRAPDLSWVVILSPLWGLALLGWLLGLWCWLYALVHQ